MEDDSGSWRVPEKKNCIFKTCNNNNLTTPDKKMFTVPKTNKAEWCRSAGSRVTVRNQFICEDHLNLQEDLENYDAWRLGSAPRLKRRLPQFRQPLQHIQNIPDRNTATASEPSTITRGTNTTKERHNRKTKGTQAKPSTADRTTHCAFPSLLKRQHFQISSFKESPTPSLSDSTSEVESSSTILYTPEKKLDGRAFILHLIKTKPHEYLGVPKEFYWIIDYLAQHFRIPSLDIILTLYKIKNNETFSKIRDFFEIAPSTMWKKFEPTIHKLNSFFSKLIYWPGSSDIKRNLPGCFTTQPDYANVQGIIDCFEIEIEKPSDPIKQALSWSQYKNGNTLKYLISATPDGFINFVSKGYGGRISDSNLVEQSGFLEVLPTKCVILADRGFKNIESILSQKQVKLLRPPSVSKDAKMTKSDVLKTKIIASLRIHIERVIRRVRVFKLLKPHSVVNNKLIVHLDEAVVISCGLINLQSPIIRDCSPG